MDASPQIRFRYHANLILIALRNVGSRNPALGLLGAIEGLATAASELGLPVPIEVETHRYPDDIVPSNLSGSQCYSGRYVIRFPDGSGENGSVAHGCGEELVVESRQSAIVALEQWIAHVEHHFDASKPAPAAPGEAKQGEGERPAADTSNNAPVGPAKPPVPRAEAERRVAAAIANTPPDQRAKLTVRKLHKATGVSVGMISGLDSWKKLQGEKAGSVRSVPLTDTIHAVLNDPSTAAADPAEVAADAEVLRELQALATTDADRTRFEAMTPGERWQMLELLKEQTADARRDQRRPRRERPDCS